MIVMPGSAAETEPHYMTTREVAELLRVKERKVYDLAAAGEIPHRRITGKLLFPSAEIVEWIEGSATRAARPDVVAGSHDPLLEWALRESGCGLATLFDGSLDGLDRYGQGQAALCGLHIPETGGWNIATLEERALRDCVLIAWAVRVQGLILTPALEGRITGLDGLAGRSLALRQPGAGAQALFAKLAREAGLDPTSLAGPGSVIARTEDEAAAAVARGDAEAAFGLESMARLYRLPFVTLARENFDLLIDRRAYFGPGIQKLVAFSHRSELAERAAAMGGYDLSQNGQVRWISP